MTKNINRSSWDFQSQLTKEQMEELCNNVNYLRWAGLMDKDLDYAIARRNGRWHVVMWRPMKQAPFQGQWTHYSEILADGESVYDKLKAETDKEFHTPAIRNLE